MIHGERDEMSISDLRSTVITGTVSTGVQQATLFTNLNWVKEKCVQLLGFSPYPGTLNIRVDGKDLEQWRKWHREAKGLQLTPPNTDYCAGLLFPGHLAEFEVVAVVPLVSGYPGDVIELMAPFHLRSQLRLKDGDLVAIFFGALFNPKLFSYQHS